MTLPRENGAGRVSPTFWVAIAGWVALVLVALFARSCSPEFVERKLAGEAYGALRGAGLSFVHVDMRGQIAVLEGVAEDALQRELAAEVVAKAAGPGGPWLGGVTAVRNEIDLGAPRSPYLWRATRTAEGVRIEGYAPSEPARASLRARAARRFGTVDDLSEIAAGAPTVEGGPMWAEVATLALDQLSQLESGEVSLADAFLVVTGRAEPAAGDAIRSALRAKLASPYAFEVDVATQGAAPRVAGLEGLDLADAAPETCQTAFDAVLETNVIVFDRDSAALSQESVPLLNTLAAIARRCDEYTVEISGHTSSEGERDLNMTLSRDRAQAVVDYLVRRGVSPERLFAQGYGPDRPIATNRTPDGRAANRRIEFTVSR